MADMDVETTEGLGSASGEPTDVASGSREGVSSQDAQALLESLKPHLKTLIEEEAVRAWQSVKDKRIAKIQSLTDEIQRRLDELSKLAGVETTQSAPTGYEAVSPRSEVVNASAQKGESARAESPYHFTIGRQ